MAPLGVSVLFAALPVADITAASAWYERLLGRPPDMRPHAGEATWQVAQAGWIYVVADVPRAGSGLVTLIVDDLDATLGELADRGIQAGSVETLGNGVRKATVADPDGNAISFGEVPSTAEG
jgi:catechol 2,3-dioxygenase-like lactoylglutathione lyase family enzyme